jgi:hypothetical protein
VRSRTSGSGHGHAREHHSNHQRRERACSHAASTREWP